MNEWMNVYLLISLGARIEIFRAVSAVRSKIILWRVWQIGTNIWTEGTRSELKVRVLWTFSRQHILF
jgi:hypothetical protein